MHAKRPSLRAAQAVALLTGALFLTAVVAPEAGRFYWTPLTLGVTYLAAALLGRRDGGHWATACGLCGWGAAVVYAGAARPDLDTSGLYLAGAGLGMAAGVLLDRAGVPVSTLGLAVTILAGGAVLALTARFPDVLEDAHTYAAALALVAVVNLGLAARELRAGRAEP